MLLGWTMIEAEMDNDVSRMDKDSSGMDRDVFGMELRVNKSKIVKDDGFWTNLMSALVGKL